MTSLEVKEFRKKFDLTQAALAEKLGVDIKTVQNWEAGRTIPTTKNVIFRKLETELTAISVEAQTVNSGERPDENNLNKIDDESSEDFVPLLPVEAMAGTLHGLAEGIELASCRKMKSPVKGADWAIQISGDSMEPDYKNGSFLFIKKMTGGMIPWGHTMVIDTYDGVVVKNIFPLDENAIEARSINPKYPPFRIENSLIIGVYRVLGGTFINSTI